METTAFRTLISLLSATITQRNGKPLNELQQLQAIFVPDGLKGPTCNAPKLLCSELASRQ